MISNSMSRLPLTLFPLLRILSTQVQCLPNRRSQLNWLAWRHNPSRITHNDFGITDIRRDARGTARHSLTQHIGESLPKAG